jgi:hypothetical protein
LAGLAAAGAGSSLAGLAAAGAGSSLAGLAAGSSLAGLSAVAAAPTAESSFAGLSDLSEDAAAAIIAMLNQAEIIKNKTKLRRRQFMIDLLRLV